MQTISVNVDAIIVKQRKQACRKLFFGALFLLIAIGGMANVWTERHTLFTYPAVWALGLALVGAGFVWEARYIFRTNNEPKGYLPLFGQMVVCVGMVGPLLNKWTRSHDPIWLWALFTPLLLSVAGLIIAGVLISINRMRRTAAR